MELPEFPDLSQERLAAVLASWAERPLGMMLDLLGGLARVTDEAFMELRP